MSHTRSHRVLVVTDTAEPSPSLGEAIRHRAESGDVKFRLIVLNPAQAEHHLLHQERHDKAAQAESVLRSALPQLELAAHARSSAPSRFGTIRWMRSRRPCTPSRSTRSSSTYRLTTSRPGCTKTSSTGLPNPRFRF